MDKQTTAIKEQETIRVRGARVHNLKDVDFDIPHNAITVVTGVSGSGKSSLAFDTIYAEGQRRYIESLSAYARQFLERIEKPDVDEISGIAPAIAIKQKNASRNPRSTVATATEIYDYLRLLYARVGRTLCTKCGQEVRKDTMDEIASRVLALESGRRFYVLYPLSFGAPGRKGAVRRAVKPAGEAIKQALLDLQKRGFNRLYQEPEPRLFSFNSPYGACPRCQGFGNTIDFDLDLVIPDRGKSLDEGAIEPWTKPRYRSLVQEMKRYARANGIPLHTPFRELSAQQRAMILQGDPAAGFAGVKGFFDWLERKKYKLHVRVFLSRYRGYATCPECRGSRLREEARAVRIEGKPITEACAMTVAGARGFFDGLRLNDEQARIAEKILEEIQQRLRFLDAVGLEYLTLDRLTSTLSGGEAQRIQLATSLGSHLVGALYVLDEPSVGLHPRDTHRLIDILK